MQLHNLTSVNRSKKRVGRGGKRGKTSGRGTKGQKARAGHRIRPEARDIIKKIPKRRGHGKHRAQSTNPSRVKPIIINFALIEKHFNAGETVSIATLLEKRLVRKSGGKFPKVKILGGGVLTKKLTFEGVTMSGKAGKRVGV